jgi:hypothetical protein
MKAVKGAMVVFIGLFIFLTLISILIPSRIVTVRAETVQADSIRLYSEIADLKNWKHWHPVFIQDSAKMNFSESSTNVNDYVEWSSNNKKNKIVIAERKFPFIKLLLQRDGENDMENILTLRQVQEQGNMQVQWTSITKQKWYPWEKFSGIFIEKMSGSGYEAALASLKVYAESHQ